VNRIENSHVAQARVDVGQDVLARQAAYSRIKSASTVQCPRSLSGISTGVMLSSPRLAASICSRFSSALKS